MTAVTAIEERVRALIADGSLDLPVPGAGATTTRLATLAALAAADLQVGRMVEAHTDAVAILREADRPVAAGALYGVWAAADPSLALTLEPTPPGSASAPVLTGRKPFCTGGGMVDRALVTVRTDAGVVLLDIDARHHTIAYDTSAWLAPAFSATATALATFRSLPVPGGPVGPPGWYLDRVGFWHGACAPAACWAGGAIGLIDRTVERALPKAADPHRDAQIGRLTALRWQLAAVVGQAGQEIDAAPHDHLAALRRAHSLRHVVERAATEVVDVVGRALGPRALAHDPEIFERIAEIQLYVRQQHAERDLAALGDTCRPPDGRGAVPDRTGGG